MIDYIDIKNLGFKKVKGHDQVYKDQYGRKYWWMEFTAGIACPGFTNEITFNWDCDTREVTVFKNETQQIAILSTHEELINYFTLFSE